MPRIPAGAKVTNKAPEANQARAQGFIGRLSTAVRYAIGGVSPDVWMSPSQPVQPVAQQAAGRQFDYPVGVNLIYTPRQGELTTFQQLRALADNCDLVRLAIETRKDQMASLKWSITYVDDENKQENDARIDELKQILSRPDGLHGWQSWLRMLMEEVMVTDAPAIYPRKLNSGAVTGFELIDGATIKVLVDDGGRTPQAPSVAYQQVLKGIPAVDYTAEELIYTPRNPRVSKFYGYGPVEQIIITVNIALRRAASQLQYFTEGNVPAAFASMPADWSGQQIKEFQAYWDSVIEGDQGYKRKMRFVPGGTKVDAIKQAPLADDFDEWLARIICYAFSLPPTQFTKQATRTTSDALQEAALKEGLAPLTVWVKEVIDGLIQRTLGYADLQFMWLEEESLDPQSQQVILTNFQKTGVYSINEVRGKLGDERITDEAGDAYLIYTASGAVTLDSVMNPPDPVAPVLPGSPKPGLPAPDEPAKKKVAGSHCDHDHLEKRTEPLTGAEIKLRDTFASAFDVVRQSAVAQASRLGKAASDVADGGHNYRPEEINVIADSYVTALDVSGLSLAWDDYSDTLIATATDGSKHEVARLLVTEPDIAETMPEIVAQIFGGKDPDAIKWATEHAAEMLTSDGTGGLLSDATRDMVRQTIVTLLQDPKSDIKDIASALQDAYAFSDERATLIAATELHNAQEQGAYAGAVQVGMLAKIWILSNAERVCDICNGNADQKWIAIDQPFQSGDLAPLAHPRCRCNAAYKSKLPEA
jgi:phage portal protein BeeE